MSDTADGGSPIARAADSGVERDHGVNLAISDEIVAVYKSMFGRGPTKARTVWLGPDVVAVLLEDTLTAVERNMARLGDHQRLRDMRTFLQYAAVRQFCEPIERITGRKVRSFVSGVDTVADGFATELFALHPEGYDGPSRSAVEH